MSIQEATRRRVEEVEPDRSQRVWTRGMIAGGAAVILLVSALVVSAFVISGDQTTQPTVRINSEAIIGDLVNRGLIPSQALEPASPSTEASTRDLVNRGLIPSDALEPESPSTEAITGDLVNRGLIPKQTLNR